MIDKNFPARLFDIRIQRVKLTMANEGPCVKFGEPLFGIIRFEMIFDRRDDFHRKKYFNFRISHRIVLKTNLKTFRNFFNTDPTQHEKLK